LLTPPPFPTPSSRGLLWTSVVLAVFLVIFSLLGPLNQVYVFLVFVIIVLEGAILIGLIFRETPVSLDDWVNAQYESASHSYATDTNRPIVSLATSVKNASEGSDYSRRTVARLLLTVLYRKFGDDPYAVRSKNYDGKSLFFDPEFQRNLANIVYRYSPDRSRRSDFLGISDSLEPALGKQEYLGDLKEILSKLGETP
jgi:hypothetical protein